MKFNRSKNLAIFLGGVMALTGCGASSSQDSYEISQDSYEAVQGEYSILFNSEDYTIKTTEVNGEEITYRAFENIVYVANPVDAEYQSLNFYVPEVYYSGGSINDYNIETAPIFFANTVGGYMPAKASTIDSSVEAGFSIGGLSMEEVMGQDTQEISTPNFEDGARNPQALDGEMPALDGEMPTLDGERQRSQGGRTEGGRSGSNSLSLALSRGYVVVSVGTRGRTNVDEDGNYTGKAPAVIVDLKAAVRYLKYNDEAMPGDANKIISNGTSAGGAISLLLGATGNSSDYESYLRDLGAAYATDDIYAVSAYCPITNLENADMAYEWQFNNISSYEKIDISNGGEVSRETLTEVQQAYSDELKESFIEYINNLGLLDKAGNVLTLNANGTGTFRNFIASYVIESAQKALDSGEDLSDITWLEISDGTVSSIDMDAYIAYIGRSKVPTAFDSVDLSSGENSLFGTETVNAQHFTEFGFNNSLEGGSLADEQIVKLMNPLNYIGSSSATNSNFWRIRHGSIDTDTSLAISTIVTNILEQNGYDVDFAFAWGKPHSGDYDLDELFDWIDSISK